MIVAVVGTIFTKFSTYVKGVDLSNGIFDKVDMWEGRPKIISNLALNDGSSKQGKAFLASTGENWVLAKILKENIRDYYYYYF